MSAMLRAVLSMSAATGLSRLTGFLRTTVMAATLGGAVVANAYTVANVLPTQIYELFMGGILSSTFIPLLVDRLTRHGEDDARRLTNALVTVVLPFLAFVALLGIIFAPQIVALTTDFATAERLSPQEARQTTDLAVLLFRVMAVQIFFYGVGAISTGVLNSHRRFFLPTFAPVLNNLIVIASFTAYVLLVQSSFEAAIYVLAGGTTLGVAVMSLVLVPSVLKLGYRPRPVLGHPALSDAVKLALPMLVFVAASVGVQVAAYRFGTQFGAAAQLLYAFVIFQLPYGIFVVSIGTALMPELSERYANEDTDGYRDTLSFGLRTMAFIAVPASVGMVALAEPIVGLLYERGAFTPADTQAVTTLLVAYGIGLLGYGAYFILVRSFYSRQNTRTPATLNLGLLALYIALAYTLSATVGLIGVALAFSAAYGALAVALLIAMRRDLKRLDGRRIAVSLAKILIAGTVMYAVARLGLTLTGSGSNLLDRSLIIGVIGGAAVATYLGVAMLLRTEELRSAVSLLQKRRLET